MALLLVPKSMPYPTGAADRFTTAPYRRKGLAGGRPTRPSKRTRSLAVNHPPVGQGPEHDQQDDRAYERRQESAYGERTRSYWKAHKPGQPAAHERSQDADHDVPQQAHAFAGEYLAGGETSDRA